MTTLAPYRAAVTATLAAAALDTLADNAEVTPLSERQAGDDLADHHCSPTRTASTRPAATPAPVEVTP